MPDLMKCTSCGYYNSTGPSACKQCGASLRATGMRAYFRGDELDWDTMQPLAASAAPDLKPADPTPQLPVTEILPGQMKKCPYCAEEVQGEAIVCKHCGRQIAKGIVPPKVGETPIVVAAQPAPSNGVAAVLSLFIPGAGQIYKGHTGQGLVWLVCVVIGYLMLIIPGMILHVACIAFAASQEPAVQPSSNLVRCIDCQHIGPKGPSSCPQCGHVYGTPRGAGATAAAARTGGFI